MAFQPLAKYAQAAPEGFLLRQRVLRASSLPNRLLGVGRKQKFAFRTMDERMPAPLHIISQFHDPADNFQHGTRPSHGPYRPIEFSIQMGVTNG